MKRHSVVLTEPVTEIIRAQVSNGRYRDFSSALQDAAWNFFVGPPSPFTEYGLNPEKVERAARRELEAIKRDRKAGRLKRWVPLP